MSAAPSKKKRGRRKLALILGGVLLVDAVAFWLWLPAYGLGAAKQFLRWNFDDIRHVSTEELTRKLEGDNPPALLDIRTTGEYETSHLPGARRLSPDATDMQIRVLLLGIPEDEPIVVYCSVGYRSSKMARRLKELGRTKVSNLDGAVFAWSGEGRPLVPSAPVHPYNWFGKRMLPKRPAAN